MEKYLEFVSKNQNRTFTFYLPFMLLPTKVDAVPQKKGCKQNSVQLDGSAGSKIVFVVLTKIITFHVRSTMVDVWGLGLEFVSRSTF